MRPDVIACADWSVRPAKRWVAVIDASRGPHDLVAVEPFGVVTARLDELVAGGRSALLGLDITLGLPVAYAKAAGIEHFPTWLRSGVDLAAFGAPAASPADISLDRPFYPARPGGARHQHLAAALGVSQLDDLRRRCERRPPLDQPACPLFWTLGANQVGKASVSAWTALAPLASVRLWPYEVDLAAPACGDRVTVAEAYPAACAGFLGLGLPAGASKRRPSDRVAMAGRIRAVLDDLGVTVAPEVRRSLETGFGEGPSGEDAYDAVVGVLGMVAVVLGRRAPGPPADAPEALTVEGWVLGV